MGSGFASCSLLICVLLVLQCTSGGTAREIYNKGHRKHVVNDMQQAGDEHPQIYAKKDDDSEHDGMDGDHQKTLRRHVDDHPSSHTDLTVNVFFTVTDLYLGKKMPIFFAIKDPSISPHIIPREEADCIPFSSSQLPYLFEFFSFAKASSQAKAMKHTLRQCELESIRGETKFCATSLESMLDSTRTILGMETRFTVLTSTWLSKSTTLLQNYTILEVPKEILAPKMVACHTMPYPYAVFYCHCQGNYKNKVFKVSLGGENGDRVEAVAVCHMDTSGWDHDHAAFRVLRIEPGSGPVCHFLPSDNLVWVPSSSVI